MLTQRRYILVNVNIVTQDIIDNCIQDSFDTLRHVRFADSTEWVVLKWRGDKPTGLWDEYPVYSDQEMVDILLNDLNQFNGI